MLLWFSVAFIALMVCAILVRAILGPRFTDRIVAIDAICSLGTVLIVILSFLFDDSGLLDVALVYAMVGFLAVVVLSKSYLLPYHDRISDKGRKIASKSQSEKEAERVFR
jgi:multicomponent Na+:H+ antiporter subunit F